MGAKIKNDSLRRLEEIHTIITDIKSKGIYKGEALDDIERLSDLNFKTRTRQSETASLKRPSYMHEIRETEV